MVAVWEDGAFSRLLLMSLPPLHALMLVLARRTFEANKCSSSKYQLHLIV